MLCPFDFSIPVIPSHSQMQVCDHRRKRGNQAYAAGEFSKAERHYSTGIHEGRCSLLPLVLCYSNRAAARISLFRMREAIEDCNLAAALDTKFLKVKLREAKCYLLLGEVEDAIQCYTKYLSSEKGVCLDRRATVEAADGLQKAEKVIQMRDESAKLLKQGTENAAGSALARIEDALSISCFSERLLEMKAEALYILRLYDQVMQLCEETLDVAKMNISGTDDHDLECSNDEFWRWNMQIKCYYHLGRFDLALGLIQKQEKIPNRNRAASIIHEALTLKRSGNEALESGRYTEAIHNYTVAISKCCDSRRFMAICYCNRAAAYQSINEITDAISDCNLAIALDENYQKAIFRRANLHKIIRNYEQAISDFERLICILECEPESKKNLIKARRHLLSIQEKTAEETSLDYYFILGVQDSDSESDVKKAYKRAALKHHPDKAKLGFMRHTGDDGNLWKKVSEKVRNDADRLFKLIGQAYDTVLDLSCPFSD